MRFATPFFGTIRLTVVSGIIDDITASKYHDQRHKHHII
jgi:hypothetical protein